MPKYGNPPLRSEKQRDDDLLPFPATKPYEWLRSSGHQMESRAETSLSDMNARKTGKQNPDASMDQAMMWER